MNKVKDFLKNKKGLLLKVIMLIALCLCEAGFDFRASESATLVECIVLSCFKYFLFFYLVWIKEDEKETAKTTSVKKNWHIGTDDKYIEINYEAEDEEDNEEDTENGN